MSTPPPEGTRRAWPLAVDLDGTLLKTDVLFEGLAACLTRAPWLVLLVPLIALVAGRPALKAMVARHAPLDPSALPFREEVLAWLRAERAEGRALVLATAAHRAPAEAIAAHLDLFDEVIATDGSENLKGARKAAALAARFPDGFAYAGDSAADLAVWARARAIVLVDCAPDVTARAHALARPIERAFLRPAGARRAWLRALRVEHWLKNLLIFAAIPAAQQYATPAAWISAATGFVLLCAIASAHYLLNDLADLASDRAHAGKRARPFAAGALPISAALSLAPALLSVAHSLSFLLSGGFGSAALAYSVLTLAYSIALKRILFADALVIGVLFTLRVTMGAALIGVVMSPYLTLFSLLFFTSIALAKRHAEVGAKREAGAAAVPGRSYGVRDGPLVLLAGVIAAFGAVAVLVLYASDPTPMARFAAPAWLWLLPAVFAAWLARIWLICRRGEMGEDPLLFATRDGWSWALAAALAAAYTLAVL